MKGKRQMKKKKLILKIFEKIGLKRIKVNQKPNISKEQMCRKAISFGVCPGICKKCAWGNMSDSDMK